MIGTIVMIAIIVAVIGGLWWTRGTGGPGALEARARAIDYESRYDPMGEPISRTDDDLRRSD